MSQITVTFENLYEMKEFARELLRGSEVSAVPASGPIPVEQVPVEIPVTQTHASVAAPVVADQMPAAGATGGLPVTTVPTAQTAPVAAIPTAPAATYSLDDLARAAIGLMDAGKQADLQSLLTRFGVTALPQLPQAQYGAFATELRSMGAQI